MSFIETISFCKVFSVAFGLDNSNILSRADLEITNELLKKMADEAPRWNQFQKETYKIMADFIKHNLEELI